MFPIAYDLRQQGTLHLHLTQHTDDQRGRK